jgi:ATP-dependent protease ClpP protease subunit
MSRPDPAALVALAERARSAIAGRRPAAAAAPWWRVSNAADAERAELYIYGIIGSDWEPDDVTAGGIVRALGEITAPAITLHINSRGGSVWDGVAIYSALLTHPATVDVSIDGVAASAASFVAMAGDTVGIQKPATVMIHDALALAIGNAAELREVADVLDQLSDQIAGVYADHAGGSVATWRTRMQTETWYTAAQAVEAGLADAVLNDTTKPAGPENRADQLIRARARVTLGRG